MSRAIEEKWDLGEIAREAWKRLGMRPAALFDMTPLELLALFGREEDRDASQLDRVAELAGWNRRAAKRGERPVVPPWLMSDAPRTSH